MPKHIASRRGATVLVGLAAAALLATGTANASIISRDGARIAAYEATLADSKESGAADTLKQFDGLAHDDQVKFLDYTEDPDNLKALLHEAADVPAAGTTTHSITSLSGGDVQITADSNADFTPDTSGGGDSSAAARLHRGWWDTTYTVSQKILGVTVTRLSLWVNYYTNGSSITKVDHADCGKRNFNAAVAIGHGTPKAWLAGGTANGEVVWEGSIVYKGFGVEIDKRHHVAADARGFKSGYLKNI
ncbi:hypothetical protein [Streptomyces mangrovisoli]|uniref:Uncharacterized protein n=1 Tax=Streptomyces mangrovisoli TaxID=1428628 RepID=A0A1J4P7W1_9ACTN|nr:hypothetical protein [Streptomyces mangrovisoli]OIJ69597.1 hypothetical protein WN71_001585 [Streptomyces mangrovisoli]